MPSSAMEMDLAKAGMHMLIEKPISMRPAEEVERLGKVISETSDTPCSSVYPRADCNLDSRQHSVGGGLWQATHDTATHNAGCALRTTLEA